MAEQDNKPPQRTRQKRSAAIFRGFFDAVPDAMILVNHQGNIVLANKQTEQVFGYAAQELYDRPIEVLIPQGVRERHSTHRADYFTAPTGRPMGRGMELAGVRKDRSEFPVEVSLSPLETDEGILVVTAVRDISERKRLERQLRERERLATMGTTVAKIAHEIGNPLNGMSATLHMLEGYLAQQPNAPANLLVAEALHDLKHETDRLRSLLRELHIFSRPPEPAFHPTNISEVAADVLRGAMAYYLERGIGVEQHLSEGVPLILADEEKLRQVLLNLYKNAAEAMPEGGILSVRGTYTETEVSLEVQDTGQGIPQGVEIFAPFVTTKTQGTGLGLAIVKQIMEAHGGTVSYTSTPGRGTTFRVTFPIAAVSELQPP
ncbi:MAG TPA: ATP-binding protein [Candidatus Binatia bacterium]|jgi:PAS domain S-box-containing protein|nr:ATP-binding protein [Candidatus Binatia bacterium]